MNKKYKEIIISRIDRFYERIKTLYLGDSVKMSTEFAWCKEPIPFEKKGSLTFKAINEGDHWGEKWESAWFNLKGIIPNDWKGKSIVAHLDFSGEGLVFNANGEVLQGITNGSIFDSNFKRTWVPLINNCQGGELVELWVEAAANSLFGVYTKSDPDENDSDRYGYFNAKVESTKLRVFDDDLWQLYLDLRLIQGLIKRLAEDSIQRERVIECTNRAIDQFQDDPKNASNIRETLQKVLSCPSSASDLDITAVGHAHIDTGWLWPVRETIRKCARTFSSQLSLIEKYPEYVFGASQPQHYQFIKDHYPEIYKRIKKAVLKGQWECQGGMWVEADCNLISGESMIRQILHGKTFFMDEFDIDVDHLWLPDVFGYSAALPQILKKSGIKYFLTQKLSWSQFNEFPHHTFIWEGIDGSSVLTHFPPENTYNSELDTEFLIPAQTNFKEKHKLNEFMSLFGVGNGGGGPKAENIELGKRLANLESVPRVKFGTAKDFFSRLEKDAHKLNKWVGELYLELHRGTFTSQAKVKKFNRQIENLLRLVEALYSSLPLDNYPQDEINRIWKMVMLNQFHDIIPGSSITEVYNVAHKEYKTGLDEIDNLITSASDLLFEKNENYVTFFNPNCYPCSDLIEFDGIGEVLIKLSPLSFKSIELKALKANPVKHKELVLENTFICYKFNSKGQLISAYDKELGMEMLTDLANLMTLYDDHPNNWDAWDIDLFYQQAIVETLTGTVQLNNEKLIFNYNFGGKSKLKQVISLIPDSKRLNFKTSVNWHEKHRMLRVSFPVNVFTNQASFDIQYGYVERPTHRNTSWDVARFEVVGHKYADLSNQNFGVALLNDCKYGYKVFENVLDLNLLRSPNNPDPDADQGKHEFTYSLLPHNGRLIESNVISESFTLNRPLHVFNGYKKKNIEIPINIKGDGLSIEVLKKAEKGNQLVVRVVELLGKFCKGQLSSINGKAVWKETNLMEWEDEEDILAESIEIKFKPFEIKTWKIDF